VIQTIHVIQTMGYMVFQIDAVAVACSANMAMSVLWFSPLLLLLLVKS